MLLNSLTSGGGDVVRAREYTFSLNSDKVMEILVRWIKPEDDDMLTRSFGPRTDSRALPSWLTNFRSLPVNTSTGHGLEFVVDIRPDGEECGRGDVYLGRVEFEEKRAGECKGYLYVAEEKEFVPGTRIEFPTPVELAQEMINAQAAGCPIESVMARHWEGPPIETPTSAEIARYLGRVLLITVWDAIVGTLQTQPASGALYLTDEPRPKPIDWREGWQVISDDASMSASVVKTDTGAIFTAFPGIQPPQPAATAPAEGSGGNSERDSAKKTREALGKIDDNGWDRLVLELWRAGHTCGEIESKTHVAGEARIRNRLSELRHIYGEDIVPTNEQRRKKKIVILRDTS